MRSLTSSFCSASALPLSHAVPQPLSRPLHCLTLCLCTASVSVSATSISTSHCLCLCTASVSPSLSLSQPLCLCTASVSRPVSTSHCLTLCLCLCLALSHAVPLSQPLHCLICSACVFPITLRDAKLNKFVQLCLGHDGCCCAAVCGFWEC